MKFRQSIFLLIVLAMITALVACGGSSKATPPPPVVSITATSGSGQNAVVSAKFAAPLVATVTTGGSPTSGATVTFMAPASGAGGTFANGTATETDTTNASGVATSSAFTANSTAGGPYTVMASVSGASTGASFSLTNTAAPVESIAATSGTPQVAAISTAFGAQLVATVTTGGTPNSGVTVTFTAPASGASGTFAGGVNTATTDANGVATSAVFTANSTIGAYTVTAAVSGVSTTANFNLTNLVATTLANGTYVFSLAGEDQFTSSTSNCASATGTACGPYFVAGAFVVSAGTITSGEQDFINAAIVKSDQISSGSVTATADGNLQITLTTADPSIGVNGGVETLNATPVTPSTGVVTEFDASATSSGFLAQQTPTLAAPSGGYAFVVSGIDTNSLPVDIGGVINVSGSAISTSGSVFDIDDDGTVSQSQSFTSGTVSGPDSLGRVEFSLVPSGAVAPINLVGYIVGPKHIWLVETGDPFQGSMGGEALGQGANTGTFSNAAPVAGSSYVFGTSGADNLTAIGAFQVAGMLTLNTDGTTVSGTLNFNDLSGTTTQSPIAVSGTYTVDSTGRVTVSGLTGSNVSGVTLQIYLSGFGDGTVASMDTTDVLAGLANQQTAGGSFTASSFAGLYAMNATGFDFNNELEFDANGPVSVDGVSALTGTVDLNFMTPPGTQSTGIPITPGAFASNANGVFTGTITGLDIDASTNNDAFTFYMIDTTKAIAIETDPNQLTLIKFALQQ